jgi:hypothetical protein
MGALIDKVWAIFLLIFGLGSATLFVDIVKRTGDSAIKATKQGLISLPELNKTLFGPANQGAKPSPIHQ